MVFYRSLPPARPPKQTPTAFLPHNSYRRRLRGAAAHHALSAAAAVTRNRQYYRRQSRHVRQLRTTIVVPSDLRSTTLRLYRPKRRSNTAILRRTASAAALPTSPPKRFPQKQSVSHRGLSKTPIFGQVDGSERHSLIFSSSFPRPRGVTPFI